MLQRNKRWIITTFIITLLPIIAGLLLWNKLPDQIPTHFDFEGTPNGYSNKFMGAIGIYLFIGVCQIIASFITAADPKKQGIGDKIFRLIMLIFPICSIFVATSVFASALGYTMNITIFGGLFIGLVFITIGNYLPKCRQNYTVGIKLPWTLHDGENWNATHRMAGPLWVVCGILMILLTVMHIFNSWIMYAILLLSVLVPVVFSYVYYLKHNN